MLAEELSCPPLYGTQRTPSRETKGDYVAKSAELLGKPFFQWQQYVADVAYEIDEETGEFAYDDITLILPRQQGKTELILPVLTHRCTSFEDPQRVYFTAQNGYEAKKKWEDVHIPRLEKSQYKALFHTRKKQNQEAILWRNGSFWIPGSTSIKTGGTGDSLDLGVIDEMWSRVDNSLEISLKPAMLTRPNHQLWRCSMIPGLVRLKNHDPKYLTEQMKMGRANVQNGVNRGTAYFEWSAPLGLDPGDPRTWRLAMPGLRCHGGLIPESAVRSDYNSMTQGNKLIDFCAEYLGWPVDSKAPKWIVISKEIWDRLDDAESKAIGTIALGVQVSPNRKHACIAAVGRRYDGNWHMEIIEPGTTIAAGVTGTDWLEDRIIDLCNKWDPCAVVIDPRSPAFTLAIPLKNRGVDIVETPNVQEISAACGTFYDGTGQNAKATEGPRIRYVPHPGLYQAVAHARTSDSPTTGSFQWLPVGSTDISELLAATLALYGYELKKPDDYQLDESIPDDYNQCRYCYACEIDGYLEHYPHCERPR